MSRPCGQQADRGAGARHRGEDAERLVAFRPFLEVGGDQREGGRRADRAADALQGACGQQHAAVLRESAEQRGEAEEQGADDEHPAAAEDVARPAAEQQQPAEGEGVRVDDPGQVGGGELQHVPDLRQRDVHDRGVEHHHQLGRGDHGQGDAFAPAFAEWRRVLAECVGDSQDVPPAGYCFVCFRLRFAKVCRGSGHGSAPGPAQGRGWAGPACRAVVAVYEGTAAFTKLDDSRCVFVNATVL